MNSNQDNEPLGAIADDGQPSVLDAPALDDTLKVMRRFNRNTMVVATGLLGTVIFAALVLAVQEHQTLPAEVAEKAMQTSCEVLPNANPVELPEVVGLSGKSSDKISSEQATSFDDGFTPEINHAGPQTNVRSWSAAPRRDSARAIANVRHRSSTRFRFVGLKMWFLALWHHGLQRAKTTRSWTQFWHSNKERRKKVSSNAKTTPLMRANARTFVAIGRSQSSWSSFYEKSPTHESVLKIGKGKIRLERLKPKFLVSSRSALSRSLQGSTGPRIDHKS